MLYKIGADVNTYLYVLIFFSLLGLFAQLAAIHSILRSYPVRLFLKNVTMVEFVTFLIPCILSLWCYQLDYSGLIIPLGVFVGVFIVCVTCIWSIGLTKGERIWVKNIVINKINKKKQ